MYFKTIKLNYMDLYNWRNTDTPNVCHFQGISKYHYRNLFESISQQKIKLSEDLLIVTFATDEDKSKLIQQLKRNNISYINAYKSKRFNVWSNPDKITLITDLLSRQDKSRLVMILDGYDVAINSFDDLITKFKKSDKKIIFNATKHNYPDVIVDLYDKRDQLGEFKYFNAGCCIGYCKDLLKFYEDTKYYLNIPNPYNSEQFIVRHAWSKYSWDHKDIDIDWECKMFQTFGDTKIIKQENNYTIV